jgi:outer membrane protein assembly factor BamB
MHMGRLFSFIFGVTVASVHLTGQAEKANHWPQFRGPDARGTVASSLPERWTATENVAWKTEIPGQAWASPIVWGDRIFLTTAINSGETEPPKKGLYFGGERPNVLRPEHQWVVLALDLASGKKVWEKVVHKGVPAGPIHVKNTYASETPVTDGERIYAYFGNLGIFCLDLQGKEIWSHKMQPHKMRAAWGTAASPIVHLEQVFIVNDNDEESYLLALDKRTGKEIWKIPREEKSNWSTPFVWQNEKRTELVTAGTGRVRSYDLNGQLIWSLKGMSSITIGTPYAADGLLYVSSGYVMDRSKPIYAIRPGATGDISLQSGQTNNVSIAWCQPNAAPYNPTTLVHDKLLYVLYDGGLLSTFDAQTGATIYHRERLPEGRHFTVSPWSSRDRIYCLNEDGATFVVRAGKTFELLHVNKLAEDDMCMAVPAIVGDQLLIRTSARLYCIKQGNRPSARN